MIDCNKKTTVCDKKMNLFGKENAEKFSPKIRFHSAATAERLFTEIPGKRKSG